MYTQAFVDQILAAVVSLEEQVRALREDQQHATRRLLAREDRRDIAVLLPAAYTLFGDSVWSAADLNACLLNRDGADELRALMAEYMTEVSGLRSFGGFLERCNGVSSGGLRLVAAGPSSDGVLYQVKRVSGAVKPAAALVHAASLADDEVIATPPVRT